MEFWYVLIGIVALLVLFPYIRCFFKRLFCARKIKKVCHNKGYILHKTHALWFLGGKKANKCDFYIETANEVFAIKFFGMPSRLTVLIFKENREFFIRRYIVLLSKFAGARFPTFDGKCKPVPNYDFQYQYKTEWESKTPRRVLLVHPDSMEIRKLPQHGGEVIVGTGDIVNGMEIDSLSRLLEDLKNA